MKKVTMQNLSKVRFFSLPFVLFRFSNF
jgi:hypothetical protein